MEVLNKNCFDIVIAGAGFGGSLTALILDQLGFKVCLLEKGKHPRFAIGESSTPIADIILRNLSVKYDLPWLYPFSRYGTWQQSYPDIVCGIKRGFSFFKHYPGKEFSTNKNHNNELLVAASTSDELSDTNWLRADFDNFLVQKVMEAKIDYLDLAEIESCTRNNGWEFSILRDEKRMKIQSSFFIDATGSNNLLQNLFGVTSSSKDFLTDSFALFSHFTEVPYWMDLMHESGLATNDYPYNSDFSATHHILEEGWLWVLRFNDGRTSMGFVLHDAQSYKDMTTTEIWEGLLSKYPTIRKIFSYTKLAGQPGKIIRSPRLQRKLTHCSGPGWVALPHTTGFVDPLFSTGISFSLVGIERIIDSISKHWENQPLLYQDLKVYETAVFGELQLLDILISGCYQTFDKFEVFSIWSMVYFAITSNYESSRMKGDTTGSFLHADQLSIKSIAKTSYGGLLKLRNQLNKNKNDKKSIQDFIALIKEQISPINKAGLLDLEVRNMYQRTAVEI